MSLHVLEEATALIIDRALYRRMLDELDPLAMRIQRQVAVAGIRQLRAATLAVARTAARIESQRDGALAFMDSQQSAAAAQAALSEWSLDFQRLIEPPTAK